MTKNNSKTKITLLQEKDTLLEEYSKLEEERKNASTVIFCQTRKNEICKRQKSIERRLYEIGDELLEVKEGYGNMGNNEKGTEEISKRIEMKDKKEINHERKRKPRT